MTPVRTVFIGSGGFGIPALRRLVARDDIELVGAVTAPPKPVGRRQELTPTEVGRFARDERMEPVLTPRRLRDPEAVDAVRRLEPELAVLADYGQIVPAVLLELPYGALNLHPSLLPRHRGASPIPAAILAGDVETGVTLMRMDPGLDTGPIVAVRRTPLDGTETQESLLSSLAAVAGELLDATLEPWLRGELGESPQPADGATLTRPLKRGAGRLDTARSVAELERQVRAYAGWPATFIETDRGRLIVHEAAIGPSAATDVAGTIVADGDGLALVAMDGRLRLRRVQPAGGRSMSAAEYRHGRRELPTHQVD